MRFEPIPSAIQVQRSATELTSQLGAGEYFSHSFSLSDLILNWLIDARRADWTTDQELLRKGMNFRTIKIDLLRD